MKKKILLVISIIVLLITSILLFPVMEEKLDYFFLSRKVDVVNHFIQKKDPSSIIKFDVSNRVTSSSRKKLDDCVSRYLTDLLDTYQKANQLLQDDEYDYIFQNHAFQYDACLTYLKEYRDIIETQYDTLNKLLEKDGIYQYCDKKYYKEYDNILKNVDYTLIKNSCKELEDFIKKVDSQINGLEYLKENNSFVEYKNYQFIISKRNIYQELENISSNSIPFQLIDDKDAPIIEANDVLLYLGEDIDLSKNIHCIDEVDGEVDCKIEGNYNNQEVGSYPYTINTCDISGNCSNKDIIVKVIKKVVSSKPYKIDVIRNQNVVIVYGLDDKGEYTKIVNVFVCSTGTNTPVGNYTSRKENTWGLLFGGVWGQYTTRIVGSILFHSVPYTSASKDSLEWEEYNKLGTTASLGCVRLSVRDAKWIYDNVPSGTNVSIYDGELPNGVTKPEAIKIDSNSSNRGWDPTDDDSSNPWIN